MNITVYRILRYIKFTAIFLSCFTVFPIFILIGWYGHKAYENRKGKTMIVGKYQAKRISVSR